MIELFVVMVVVAIIGIPLALSITALVFAVKARKEIREIRIGKPSPLPKVVATPSAAPPAEKKFKPVPVKTPAPSAPAVKREKDGLEVVLGGRVASFIGIGVLLIGIAFLVGYAIRNAWFGPGARVVIGLLAGGVLVVLGHLCEVRGESRLKALARALTGGGAALFYFTIFAAYEIYELIPVLLAGTGLLISALAVMALALAYSSQAVAIVGLLGAFITPLLIGGDYEQGVFPLAYIALLNLPVMILGVRRRWQSLYNIAFGLTVLFVLLWIDWFRQDNLLEGILFTSIYFLEFAFLGLLKLRNERRRTGRVVDIVRLCLNSLLYLAALYWLFEQSAYESWTATAFLVVAAVHVGIARAGWRWLPAFSRDTLAFLVGGLTFASLALPIQLDGAWVSSGWAIEGLVLCWFALRVGSRQLRAAALLLGLVGLCKTLLIDVDIYVARPDLFLNARFGSGMLCALLLGGQAWLTARTRPTDDAVATGWEVGLIWTALAGVLAVFSADAFWTLGSGEAWAWTLTSLALLLVAVFAAINSRSSRLFRWPALILLLLFPLKIMLDLLILPTLDWWDAGGCFMNMVFGVQLVGVLVAIAFLELTPIKRLYGESGREPLLNAATSLIAVMAAIALISSEFMRIDSDWSSSAVTIWWALSAIGLAVFGLVRGLRRYRYAGLALISLVLLKIFFFDLSQLRDLERIAAFIGTGVLLLLLSYLYQRMAARFTVGEDGNDR